MTPIPSVLAATWLAITALPLASYGALTAHHQRTTDHTPGGPHMPDTRTLPHDDYIEAVSLALDTAGLPIEETRTGDCETRGTYCYLNAVIALDLYYTSDADEWPHGLLLIWEWHTGIEDGEPERGPVWLFAELNEDGSNWFPTVLPVYGYASPAAVVEAARKVIDRKIRPTSFDGGSSTWDGELIGDSWEQADELDAACEAWGKDEGAES